MACARRRGRLAAGAAGALCAGLLLGGCGTPGGLPTLAARGDLPARTELRKTPFFPQEAYQCGPASLAMALRAAGIEATPERLSPQVYLPERQGSLQIEMLAAARRNGAFAIEITPTLEALLEELAAGNPVVVLQNLSLPISPMWHYAVVIGYDLGRGDIVLRSGKTERLTMTLANFDNTWARSERWGMVALAPGRLPAKADAQAVLNAAVAFEKTGARAKARRIYEAAVRRWPDELALEMGLGNAAYAVGDRHAAESAFRRATRKHPDAAPAFNNLAVLLIEDGRWAEAYSAAQRAVALGEPWTEQSLATLRRVEAQRPRQTSRR